MTDSYEAYQKALLRLRDSPQDEAHELEEARNTQAHARALADKAEHEAGSTVAWATRLVEHQLDVARQTLEPLGRMGLIPPHVSANEGWESATKSDIADAQRGLVEAIDRLRTAVTAEQRRIEAAKALQAREQTQQQRLALEAQERDAIAAQRRQRRQRRQRLGAVVIPLLLVLLLVIINLR